MANLTNPFQATAFPTMNKNFLGNAFTPTDTSGDSKSFPGLTVNEENEIFSACDNANMTQYERNLLANDLYKKKIEQKNSEKKNQEKAAAHLELVNKAAITTDPKTKNSLNNTARKHEVADMIRNYVMNANGKDLTDVDDGQLIHDFSQENQQAAMAIDEFINGNESSSYFSKKMGFSQQDEEKEQSGFEQWLTGLGDRFQAFGRGVDNLLSKGQSAVDESGVDLNAYTKYIQDKYGVSYPAKLDKATRDKEYATVKENPELLKPYMTSTSDDVLDVAEGGVDIAFSSFNPYATAAFTTAGGLESLMGGGALTWFGEKMGGIGSVINELPGLSQFRDSLSEENQARFDQFVANSALGLMLGVKNKSNIYKNPKQFLVENLQPNQITKNFMENVVGISEKAYSGIQRAGNFARGIEGGSLSKMASRMTNGLDGLSEWGAEKLTKTSSAQDKLYKAQEPRMNVLSEKKNLEQRRANSDRANQLIVENGYKPTNTSERLQAHDATLKKLWNDVLTEVNKGEGVFADQSSIINALDEYIKNQKELGIDASKADIKALEGELNAMKKQQAKGELDFPTLEKKKQVYNDLIDWKGTEASEVYKKGIKLITSEIGKLEDAMLSEIPGEFSQLKRDVGALIDTYEDVFKADMKNQRKKGLGLTETYSRLEGISDTLGGIFQLFKGDVSGVAKGLSKVALGKAMAKATDVDFLVKKGFEELSKSFEENQVSSKTAPKIQEGIKTDQAVFDELSNYILDVNKEYSAEDISALGEMIDKSRKSLSREDYQTLKDALREQIQNRDLAIEEAEWLRTEGKAIEMGEDIKAVKEFQKRILEIEEQEKNIGKVAGKKVNRTYADQQMRAWESKREKLIKELEEYYDIDQFEAAAKYDELLERANINDFRKDSNRGKYQVADEPNIRELTLNNTKKEGAYDPRASLPNPRGGWTKAKIEKQLKEPLTAEQRGVRAALRAIQEFDNADDFKAHTFYHGTQGSFVGKPTMSIPEKTFDKMADQFGGGYGERYWAISLTTDKKIASNFGGASDHVNINPVILRKNAKVIEMPELSDSVELADHIEQLWNDGVDAVWIGDKYSGEKELAVLNPKAIVNLDSPDRYRQYHLGMEDNPLRIKSDADFDTIYENASKYRQELSELDSKANELREKFFKDNYGKSQFKLMDEDSSKYKEAKQAWENSPEKAEYDKLKSEYNSKLYEVKDNIRFQKYGTAGEGEKGVNAIQGLNIRNFKNGKSVKELANNYGIKTHIVDSISTPEGQKAYGMYGDRVITLARDLKESTVPHELLHATFDMVDSAKRTKILEGIQKRLKVDDVQAEEWLADNFSEYYRTGKFDTKAVPTTLAGQIKQFFQQIKEFIDGTYANRKEITQLFDDIIDGKIEGEYGVYSDPKFQSVWHGSPYSFEKFDSSHMGEGEGAQAHGWGHYVAVDEKTGRHYAEMGGKKLGLGEYKGKSYDKLRDINLEKERGRGEMTDDELAGFRVLRHIYNKGFTVEEAIKDLTDKQARFIEDVKGYIKKGGDEYLTAEEWKQELTKIEADYKALKGLKAEDFKLSKKNLYNLDIPDPKKADTPTGSNYLEEGGRNTDPDFREKFIKPEQVDKFVDALKNYDEVAGSKLADKMYYRSTVAPTMLGRDMYKELSRALGSDKEASKFLNKIGYDGIHYFGGIDGEAYVIFNDDALKINSHEQY